MQMVATEGNAGTVFANYPVSIACKTGTAETSTGKNGTEPNLSFICYAPADDPEIAVAVMIEQGNTGNYAKNVAKDILDQYFGFYTWDEDGNKYDQEGNQVDDDGVIIKTAEELAEEQAAQEQQSGDASSDSEDGDAASQEPSASPTPGRGNDIPDTPFTGESASPAPDASGESSGESSQEESSASSSEESAPGVPSGAPYYRRE